jgi:quercetin dioxygenase-like cupin family protein
LTGTIGSGEKSLERQEEGASVTNVLMQGREGAEQLGRAVLLAATDDLVLTEYDLETGTEPGDPHYHANHSDSFYVIEGELEFQIDGKTVRAKAGTLVVAPRGAVHAFPVAVGSRARFLNRRRSRFAALAARRIATRPTTRPAARTARSSSSGRAAA